MKRFCLILSLWLASLHIVIATVQDPEYVKMGGASYWMKATFPIEEDSILSKNVADELETLRGSLRKGNDNPQALIEIGRNIKNQFPEVKNGLKVYCNGGVFDQLNNLPAIMI